MRRLVLMMGLASLLVAQLAGTAHAQRRGRGREKPAPRSEAIAKDLGDMRWGMSLDEVMEKFTSEVREEYRPKIAKVHSAIKEDQLRAKMRGEIKKLHDSAVRFNGRKTGWDVSFLKGEFTHNNNEALMVVEDDKSKTFYFFIRDHLWKIYKAFDIRVFRGADFEQFAQAVQGRYGEGAKRKGEVASGDGERQWLEWQDKNTRLRAVDQTDFYGFYALVFEDKETLRRLPELRRNSPRNKNDTHSLVEQVTSVDDSESDVHQDVADRITGRLRRKQNAPKGSGGSGSKAGKSGSPPPREDTGPAVSEEDDPLRGLF